MSYITVEVDIDHGKITAREPNKLPAVGKGVLSIRVERPKSDEPLPPYKPLIHGEGKQITLLTREQLDAAAWGD